MIMLIDLTCKLCGTRSKHTFPIGCSGVRLLVCPKCLYRHETTITITREV